MEQAWKKVYPGTPFNYRFLDDAIAAMYTTEEKTAVLMNTAMVLTIFISCMGLFGLAMFTAGQRKKEVGIRKVLGATVMDITLMLSGSFARLIAIAVLIASPIAWYLMNKLAAGLRLSYLHRGNGIFARRRDRPVDRHAHDRLPNTEARLHQPR
jgi:putative ABC transport system permease protein